jgi:peptidoglycan/xylan/chitin deacetylase (PgdA/CDA1 family)
MLPPRDNKGFSTKSLAGTRKRTKDLLGRFAGMSGLYGRIFRSRMTVVAFHRVNDQMIPDDLTCSSAKFEAFCKFFRRYFRVVPLSEQISGLRSGSDMGGTLSITFDDGYLDNLEVAAPILLKLRLPATFFITTGFIGSQAIPAWDMHLAHQPGWMSWDQVRKLHSMGFEIGSHTDTHLDLGTSDAEAVRADLKRSQRKLRDALGVPVKLFAYPFGGPEHISQRSRELVREVGFTCCAACYSGSNASAPDPFEINRIGIANWFATPDQFGFELLTSRT